MYNDCGDIIVCYVLNFALLMKIVLDDYTIKKISMNLLSPALTEKVLSPILTSVKIEPHEFQVGAPETADLKFFTSSWGILCIPKLYGS